MFRRFSTGLIVTALLLGQTPKYVPPAPEQPIPFCHRALKKDSAAIQRLAALHEQNKPVEWRRVYRLPEYVFFSHKEHVAKGAACETCHGPVGERDVLRKEKEISMAACMDCHRAK